MKVVFFGLGSIGLRHARLLKANFNHDIVAFRSGKKKPGNELGFSEIYTWADLKKFSPDVAFITNPTAAHISTALRCAELGINLFIEKPLSNSLRDVSILKSTCLRKRLTCYTAYNLRFHPVIAKIKEWLKGKEIYHARIVCSSYLPDWRPDQDHLKNYSASKKLGGGVILELSHEFDYIQYLLGSIDKVCANHGRRAKVTVDAEDFADVLIKLKNALPINLHLNFLSRLKERSIKIDFKDGFICADLFAGKLQCSFQGKEQCLEIKIDRDDLYIAQLNYFFNNFKNKKLMNNLEESSQLLEKILEAKK